MFSSGPAQHALGRPQDRRSAAGSSASRGLLQGAACPPSLAELIFCLHSVACLSSIGPTLLFRMFSAFPDVDSKVCVCVCVCIKCVCVCVCFVLRLQPFPPFSVSPYIRMYVRALLGPVGACVRLCLRVLLPADAPSATRVRPSNFSSVNEIR